MTRTMKILRAMLKDGQPRTPELVAVELGVTDRQSRDIIYFMRRFKYVVRVGDGYVLTDAGRAHGAPRSLEVEAKLERKAARTAMLRGKPPAPIHADGIVDMAVVSRPPLDMAWMSVAREQEASHVCRSGAREGVGA